MRVLLVEDDVILAQGIARALRDQAVEVTLFATGAELLAAPGPRGPTVLVLDIGLPDMDGFEVVRQLRARRTMLPVLLLTARDAVANRVRGLETGADDYLVKPFATPELIARIRALARRAQPGSREVHVGRLILEMSGRRARIGERFLDLSTREWTVLAYLSQQPGRVVSKQQIITAILPWGEAMSDNAVEVYISRVRMKTAEAGVVIRTIRGFGYLLQPVDA